MKIKTAENTKGLQQSSWEMSRETEGVSNNVEGSFRDRTMHEAM